MRRMLVLALSLAFTACASLQEEGDGAAPAVRYDRPGPYVGGSLLHAFEDFDDLPSADDSEFGMGLRGGVRLDPRFAVEGVIEGAFGHDLSGRRRSAELDVVSVGVQGKVFLLPERQVQPYVLAGFGATSASVRHFDADDDGPYLRLGAGADWYLNPTTALFTELTRNESAGDIHRLDHTDFQVGVLFHF